jgi:hypothetical protein
MRPEQDHEGHGKAQAVREADGPGGQTEAREHDGAPGDGGHAHRRDGEAGVEAPRSRDDVAERRLTSDFGVWRRQLSGQ